MANNWTISETKELFELVYKGNGDGKGLVWAFEKMSDKTGKSLNSVRNYYYSQLKMFQLVPKLAEDLGIRLTGGKREEFELFTQNEIEKLVETILMRKAKGESVRAVIIDIAKGDTKLALRYQNKYRSMVSHHRDRVLAIMAKLDKNGIKYFNPYYKLSTNSYGDNFTKLAEYIGKLDEKQVGNFLNLITKLR